MLSKRINNDCGLETQPVLRSKAVLQAIGWGRFFVRRFICSYLLCGLIYTFLFTQETWSQFVDINAGLEPLNRGVMQWGDYDNDGDLDLLSSGCGILNDFNDDCDSGFHTYIYRNDGGAFSQLDPGITGVSSGNVQWGDYENDGDLDVLVVGRRGGDFAPVGEIFRNTGGSVFSSINAGLVAVKFGTGVWGDYDGDGDLDVFISGRDINNTRVTRLYRNDNESFTQVSTSLPHMDISSASWIDYDKDGDLDLFMNGNAGAGKETRLYRNLGDGLFSEVSISMEKVEWASSEWGDYDNDGDPDLLLAGIGDGGAQTRIYRNTNGVFDDIGAGLTGTGRGRGTWGDYDNDGLLDVLLVGLTDAGKSARVYRNQGGGSFSLAQSLDTVDYGTAAWGDYDGDGDLDIALSGLIDGGSVAAIYRNDAASQSNTPPATPTGLNVDVTNPDAVVFTWEPASDSQTNGNALTYALRVGTSPGGSEVLAANANGSGQRKLVQNGNAGYATRLTLRNMDDGTYYWSVQAVDQGFAGSSFATEQTFQIGDVASNTAPNLQALADLVTPAHNEPLEIQTTVTDLENNLADVWINWRLDDQLQAELPMMHLTGELYRGEVPGVPGGSRVALTIMAEDSLGLVDSTQVPAVYVVRPSVPASVDASFQNNQVMITWQASIGAERYHVYRVGDAGPELAGTVADTTYREAGSTSEAVAGYRVAAVNEGGQSELSEEVLAPLCQPAAPSMTALAGPERVVLNWDAETDCTVGEFELRRNGEVVVLLPADAVIYADEGLSANITYSYTLKALGVAGVDSDPGTVVQAIPFAYPGQITLNNGGKSFGDYTRPASYRLVGLPGDADTPLVSTTEGNQREDWNAFRDNGNASDNPDEYLVEYSSALPELFVLEAGKGFWLVQKSPWTVQQESDAVQLDFDNTFTIDLQAGWNIITNPFDTVVNWNDVVAVNPDAASSLESIWAFDDVFSESSSMAPYEGYYFFNGRTPPLEGLKIPLPAAASAKTAYVSASKQGAGVPTLILHATDDEGRQVSIKMGLAESASEGLDGLDRFGPPAAFAGISMRLFNENLESSYKWLAEEYRTLDDDGQIFEFDLALGQIGQRIRLDLEGQQYFEDDEIRLVDLQRGAVYELGRQSHVWIEPAANKERFYLLMGDRAFVDKISSKVVPATLTLAQNYPNPFSNRTTIVYTLPELEHVQLLVYNVLGQHVATLADQMQSGGRYEVEWGENVPSGVYLYQLRVGATTLVKTMILRK